MRLSAIVPAFAPILLACLVAPGGVHAGDAVERDQHLIAIKALVDADMALPAMSQLKEFLAAGYPDDDIGKVVTWYTAEMLKANQVGRTASLLDQYLDSVKADMERIRKAPAKLPETAASMLRSFSSPLSRLNRVLTGPEMGLSPWLRVTQPAATLAPERSERVTRQALALAAAIEPHFSAAKAEIDAFSEEEKKHWDLDERDPLFAKIAGRAISMREAAMLDLFQSIGILRELSMRGEKELNLAPATVQQIDASLRAFLTKYNETLVKWSNEWGNSNPFLTFYVSQIRLDGVRLGIKGIKAQELISEMRYIADQDATEAVGKDKRLIPIYQSLQLRCWMTIFATCLAEGPQTTPKAEKNWKDLYAAKNAWLKKNTGIGATAADRDLRIDFAKLCITAGRCLEAKGSDSQARAEWGLAAGVREMSYYVNSWTQKPPVQGGSNWAETAVAIDPESALGVAKSYYDVAEQSATPELRRNSYMNAAIIMRNAVLGLTSGNVDRSKLNVLIPRVYGMYALCLSKAEMRWHAAVVGLEGMKAIEAAGGAVSNRVGNPWRDRNGKLIEGDGKTHIIRYVKNANAFAGNLRVLAEGGAASTLNADILNAYERILPEEKIEGGWKVIVRELIAQKKYAEAIKGAKDAANSDKAANYWDAVSLIIQAYMTWHTTLLKANDKTAADKILTELDSVVVKVSAEVEMSLKAEKAAAKRKLIQQTQRALLSVKIYKFMQQEKYAEVLDLLGENFWNPPPADASLGLSMLASMASASFRFAQQALTVKSDASIKPKGDAKGLIAAWARLDAARGIYLRLLPRLESDENRIGANPPKALYNALLTVEQCAGWILANSKAKDAPEALRNLSEDDRTRIEAIKNAAAIGFAKVIEPALTKDSDLSQLITVGTVLVDGGDAGGARIVDLALAKMSSDAAIAGYWNNPGVILNSFDQRMVAGSTANPAGRLELKETWAVVRDYLEDSPATIEAKINNADASTIKEKTIDFSDARKALETHRRKVEALKGLLLDKYPDVIAACTELDNLIVGLSQNIALLARRATMYRATGDNVHANELYKRLLDFNPTNPEFLGANIELTIDQVRAGKDVAAEELKKAQVRAALVRDSTRRATPLYWQSHIQIYELFVALKQIDKVNEELKWIRNGNSGISQELITRMPLDDARVRRAKDQLAVNLATRFLKFYEVSGVTEKPTFRVETLEVDNQKITIFANIDAPEMVASTVKDEMSEETYTFVHSKDTAATDVLKAWLGRNKPPEPTAGSATSAAEVAPSATTSAGK